MARETVAEKALRYLGEGRLRVVRAEPGGVEVYCRGGSHEPYVVTFQAGHWRCSCPAWRLCAHVHAAQLVTAPEPSPRQLADARAHDRYHAPRTADTRQPIEPAGRWEMAGGSAVLDTCPDCGALERVAVTDGRCPDCTRAAA